MQMTREEYEELADIVLVNNGDESILKEQVDIHIREELEKRGIRI